MPNVRVSADDHVIFVNGIPVGHFIEGTCQADTGSAVTDIVTAEGVVGQNVAPAARSRPGSGSFSFASTSPDAFRLALLSAGGDEVTVSFRVVKNFSAYSYKEFGLTSAILGPVSMGPAKEAREVPVTFKGTGYFIVQ